MRLKQSDFLFRESFTNLTDAELHLCIEVVNTTWSGVGQMWNLASIHPDIKQAKRELLLNWLVAWLIATRYPEKYSGTTSGAGAIPLASKKIDDISLRFLNLMKQDNQLAALQTNEFGIEALLMLQSAPEMYMLH